MRCSVIPCLPHAARFSAAAIPRNSELPAANQALIVDELVMRYTLAASVEAVFRYWTTPVHLARWWSPCPVPADHCRLDVRPGGAYRICIRTHEGSDHWLQGVYHSVAARRQLSFSWAWEGAAAGPASLVIVSFAREGNHTRLLLCHTGFASLRARAAHQAGWEECFERLQALSASSNR